MQVLFAAVNPKAGNYCINDIFEYRMSTKARKLGLAITVIKKIVYALKVT
jgi:hypothetical protein